jgi:hypothetical protein
MEEKEMYKIEYYNEKGCFELGAVKFRTLREAEKYARRNRARLGVHFVILSA